MNHPAPIDTDAPKSHGKVFLTVFLLLCALTGLSFWIANSHLMDDRFVGWMAMMGVSVAKAFLVITFFMHLWWEKNWKYVMTIPAFLMAALLVMLLVPDVADRVSTYSRTRSGNAPKVELKAAEMKAVESNQPDSPALSDSH
jgi:cytochrome c oxidase subunit 4